MIDLNNIRRKFGEFITEHPEEKWRIDSAFIHVIEHVYKQSLVDADVNAPWLAAAHMLCTDAGIEPGHISDRLEQLRQILALPASADDSGRVNVQVELTKEVLDGLIHAGWTPPAALDMSMPECVRERWNFEAGWDKVMVCRNEHDKGGACTMTEMHPVDVVRAISDMRAYIMNADVRLSAMGVMTDAMNSAMNDVRQLQDLARRAGQVAGLKPGDDPMTALVPAIEALASKAAPKKKRQYFYKTNECPAVLSSAPNCICWHDEGTGPLAAAKYFTGASGWREVIASGAGHD